MIKAMDTKLRLKSHNGPLLATQERIEAGRSTQFRFGIKSLLPQEYALRYDETYWNTSINVKKNQALTFDHIDYYKPYERVPQITFNGYGVPSTGGFVIVRSGGAQRRVSLDAATGRVTVSN